jgi:hypothetical protein
VTGPLSGPSHRATWVVSKPFAIRNCYVLSEHRYRRKVASTSRTKTPSTTTVWKCKFKISATSERRMRSRSQCVPHAAPIALDRFVEKQSTAHGRRVHRETTKASATAVTAPLALVCKSLGRPAFSKVPAERQTIGALAPGFLIPSTSSTTTVVLSPSRRHEMHLVLGQADLNG